MFNKSIIIAPHRYNPHELWVTLGVLKKYKVPFTVLSTYSVIFDEVTCEAVKVRTVTPQELWLEGDPAIIFISGNTPDTISYWENPVIQQLVTAAMKRGLLLAGICMSVPILHQAVRGKKVSVFPLKRALAFLEERGAIISPVSITLDTYTLDTPNLITAENESVTQTWIETIVDIMKGNIPKLNLVSAPAGMFNFVRERKPVLIIERIKRG